MSIYPMYKVLGMNRELLRATLFNRPLAYLNTMKHLLAAVVLLLLLNLVHLFFYHHLALYETGMLVSDLIWLALSIVILFFLYQFWKEIR